MKELLRCRAMESRCRQRAALYPAESWKWMAEAEMWQHKALDETASHFEACNTNPVVLPKDMSSKYTGL